ncbi:MAG: AGE family epimerase/isomerase [Cytophagales bacterium]|nr:AGE family epimerase/isomerase [Armatimonadota bacterium]
MMPCLWLPLALGCAVAAAVLPLCRPAFAAPKTADSPLPPTLCRRLADETDRNLREHVLAPWFPRALDQKFGGFYEAFDEQWARPVGDGNVKSVVYQSRLTWIASRAAHRYPQKAVSYRAMARHGVAVLSDRLWDRENGGFFWSVSETGEPFRNGEKHAYGVAFAIYAASAAYQATGETRALDLAKRAYAWLETHAQDTKNGGYYEALTCDGKPILTIPTAPDATVADPIGMRYGFKSMNGHIHLLEALTALYGLWPDAGLRARLKEMLRIVRDKVAVEPGCLNLFFTPQWRPVPDHDSFGHDVETAYLLTEASAVLGRPDDAKTWATARRLVDHALAFGWDEKNGGFYDAGSAFGAATITDKVWWTQAEGLNALLLMHERYGRETPRYGAAFLKQWEFITRRQIDYGNTGWLGKVSAEGVPIPGQIKSDAWKDPYHQGRALLNVSQTLRKMANEKTKTP